MTTPSIEDMDELYSRAIRTEANSGDEERDHIRADALLTELLGKLGFHRTVEAFEKVDRWCA